MHALDNPSTLPHVESGVARSDRAAAPPGTRTLRPSRGRPARSNARLMPTLFDRLRDESPQNASETEDEYTVSASELRRIVQRDLGLLLNTTNAEDLIDRDRHPEVAVSTLNYGVPALAGSQLTSRKWGDIEVIIKRAIKDFEPRLIPDSVKVSPRSSHRAGDAYNVLMFEIRAMIRQEPFPLELMVQSSVDLETNRMRIVQASPGSVRGTR